MLGHRSPKMAIFYVQQADKKRLGRTATVKWNAYVDERAAMKGILYLTSRAVLP